MYTSDEDRFYEELNENFEGIKWNPIYFLEFLNSLEPKKPLHLFKWQLEICEYIVEEIKKIREGEGSGNIFVAIAGSRGSGKTVLVTFLLLWGCSVSWELNAFFRMTANTNDQIKRVLWVTINRIFSQLHFQGFLKNPLKEEVSNLRNHLNTIKSAVSNVRNTDALKGEHADFGIRIFDEASSIEEGVFTTVFNGLATGINLSIMTSNPVGRHGFFYQAFEGTCGYNFKTKNVSAFDCENSMLNSEFFRIRCENALASDISGDQYRVNILGQFPLTNLILFFAVEEYSIEEIALHLMPPIGGVLGVDIASGEGGKTDRTVIVSKQGGIIYVRYVGRIGIPELADELTLLSKKVAHICIDAVSIGIGLRQLLARSGVRNIAVKGNDAPRDAKHRNRRAELYCELRDFLGNGGQIVVPRGKKKELEAELRSMRAFYTDDGKIQMISKKDLTNSPDITDALTYSFAAKVNLDGLTGNYSRWI